MSSISQISKQKRRTLPYPENLMYDVLVEDITVKNPGHRLTDSQKSMLETAMGTLTEVELLTIRKRYEDLKFYREIGEDLGLTAGKCESICANALRKLNHPDFRKKYREL